MSEPDKRQIVDHILGTCLGYLVEIEFVSREAVSGTWYSRHDMNERLAGLQFFAAASIDDAGRPVVVFNIEQDIKPLAWAMAHEAVHLAQLCKGDWEPFNGYSIWKGKRYENLSAEDENYFSEAHQPWEAEAFSLEGSVREKLYELHPVLKSS